jgi:release factor glutamine methyltransferase
MEEIYSPAEDSYLLQEVLEKEIPKFVPTIKVLEVGAGSGNNLEKLKSLGVKNISSCDINPKAVKKCKSLGFSCIESNLFEKIKGKFDLIIFNPPYLPEDKREEKISRIATTGGKKGSEIINKFLKQAKKYLNKNGKIFLISSSLTKGINWNCCKKKLISRKKIFFEELRVWEISFDK